jgi:hypothetical protein
VNEGLKRYLLFVIMLECIMNIIAWNSAGLGDRIFIILMCPIAGLVLGLKLEESDSSACQSCRDPVFGFMKYRKWNYTRIDGLAVCPKCAKDD